MMTKSSTGVDRDSALQAVPRKRALPARVRDDVAARLVREGHITEQMLTAALAQSAKEAAPLHEVLLMLGHVDERTAYKALAAAAGVPLLEPAALSPTPLAFRLVPERVARRHGLLPIAVDDRTITYAIDRLYDEPADRDVGFTTGRKTEAVLACPSELHAAIARSYPFRAEIDSLVARAQSRVTSGAVDEVKLDVVTDSAVVDLCNMLLARAVDAGASDMHLDPDVSGILVRLRVAGVLESVKSLPGEVAMLVRNRFKILGGTDISVRNRPQDGGFSVTLNGRRIDVRLSTLPTTQGEKLVMRVIDSHSQLKALETLGYDQELLARLKRVLDRPDGLVLVTGPTGSGKTTALYAALNYLHNGRVNIVSVEDPVERSLAGVNQIPVNTRAGNTFASVLRAVLRQDPNVLMVGEIRDSEVAGIVGQAAYTGQLVLSSVHTIDAATAVTRLLNLGLEPFRIAESLSGILAQRLVRRLCRACSKAGRKTETTIGCDRCHFTGFDARIPVAELLTPSDEVRTMIARGATAVEIRQAMRRAGFPSMHDHGKKLVAAGLTSSEELLRVLGSQDEDEAAATPQRTTVLIAEDEPITRTLVRMVLEKEGYAVIEAKTGLEAIALAHQHSPHLIVMDLNMPEMDGYDAIAALRGNKRFSSTPIVVVTAEEGPRVQEHVIALGADDYIVKPFEPQLLTSRVKASFGRHEMAA